MNFSVLNDSGVALDGLVVVIVNQVDKTARFFDV